MTTIDKDFVPDLKSEAIYAAGHVISVGHLPKTLERLNVAEALLQGMLMARQSPGLNNDTLIEALRAVAAAKGGSSLLGTMLDQLQSGLDKLVTGLVRVEKAMPELDPESRMNLSRETWKELLDYVATTLPKKGLNPARFENLPMWLRGEVAERRVQLEQQAAAQAEARAQARLQARSAARSKASNGKTPNGKTPRRGSKTRGS